MRYLCFCLVLCCGPLWAADSQSCLTTAWDKAALLQLKQQDFVVNAEQRQQLWSQLPYCLASPDPQLRDDVAFSAFASWLRAGVVGASDARQLLDKLQQDVQQHRQDDAGVYLPFALLVMSELVRLDRVQPYLTAEQRQQVLDTVQQYLQQLTDYRGFDQQVGWRHAVAHSADVLMQLALNPALQRQQMLQVLTIVRLQLRPQARHFYIYGEPQRLARPVLYLMVRPELRSEDWQQWLAGVMDASAFGGWAAAMQSQAGLAARHNSLAFVSALYLSMAKSQQPQLQPIKPMLLEAIAQFQ